MYSLEWLQHWVRYQLEPLALVREAEWPKAREYFKIPRAPILELISDARRAATEKLTRSDWLLKLKRACKDQTRIVVEAPQTPVYSRSVISHVKESLTCLQAMEMLLTDRAVTNFVEVYGELMWDRRGAAAEAFSTLQAHLDNYKACSAVGRPVNFSEEYLCYLQALVDWNAGERPDVKANAQQELKRILNSWGVRL